MGAVEGQIDYITDEVRALIGVEGEVAEATHPVEGSEVRRFQHAIMDPSPRYWDGAGAKGSRYGSVVAPPTFPAFAFRRPADAPDTLDAFIGDPDFDGHGVKAFRNLPAPPVPLRRILNGGYRYYFYRYARLGDRLFRKSRYRDIYQKNGKNGAMVFVVIDDVYMGEDRKPILVSTQTIILR